MTAKMLEAHNVTKTAQGPGQVGMPDMSEPDANGEVEERMKKALDQRQRDHGHFRSRRRTSITPTKTMIDALQTRAKNEAHLHADATAVQARFLAEDRIDVGNTQAATKSMRRNRRLSCGMEAGLAFEALTKVFASQGTTDDMVRPENNAQGVVFVNDREMISRVLCNSVRGSMRVTMRARARLRHAYAYRSLRVNPVNSLCSRCLCEPTHHRT